ncbi:hypothetical protein LSAT2_012670 [Lamellibrachia satsuma]|nr:hypothetical protein LSAT2_012670 [Lamellibrachia satsuma]
MDFPFGARNASEVLPPLVTSHPIYAFPYAILLGIFALVGTLGNILVIGTNLTLKEKDQMVGDIFIVNLAASDMIVTALINPVAILGVMQGAFFYEGQAAHVRRPRQHLHRVVCRVPAQHRLHQHQPLRVRVSQRHLRQHLHAHLGRLHVWRHLGHRLPARYAQSSRLESAHFRPEDEEGTVTDYGAWELVCVGVSSTAATSTSTRCSSCCAASACHSSSSLGPTCASFMHLHAAKESLMKTSNKTGKSGNSAFKQSMKQAKMMLAIFIVFVFLWSPYLIVLVVDRYDTFPQAVHLYASLFAHMHASVNFIIYGDRQQEHPDPLQAVHLREAAVSTLRHPRRAGEQRLRHAELRGRGEEKREERREEVLLCRLSHRDHQPWPSTNRTCGRKGGRAGGRGWRAGLAGGAGGRGAGGRAGTGVRARRAGGYFHSQLSKGECLRYRLRGAAVAGRFRRWLLGAAYRVSSGARPPRDSAIGASLEKLSLAIKISFFLPPLRRPLEKSGVFEQR